MTAFTQRALIESDAAAYAALTAAVADAGGSDLRSDEEQFRFYLHHPMGAREFESIQGVFDADRLVAMGWVARRAQADPVHWMHADASVHPDYLGRGIGTQLVHWQADCARRIHEHYFPGRPLELETRVAEGNEAARELLANEGYAPERWFFRMRRPAEPAPPDAEPPTGLVLETYTPEVAEELRLAQNEAFLDHWRFVPHTVEDWMSWITGYGICQDLSFLLRDPADGRIAGYLVSSFKEAEFKASGVRDLHLSIIGTRAAYRGRGIASALIGHAIRESRKQGYQGATLMVDAENPSGALGVYERSGFAWVQRNLQYSTKLES